MWFFVLVLLKAGGALSPANYEAKKVKYRKNPDLFEAATVQRSASRIQRAVEVMAPAGGWPQLRAAVYNGADAVYLGLSTFSARSRASNFEPGDDLKRAVQFAHENEVYVYVAINTLAFDDEYHQVDFLLEECKDARVDAVIIQDLGIQKLAVSKHLTVHASTQQSISSVDGADFAYDNGATRVVLGRELSVSEITTIARSSHAEIEVFVHGALCISWSGQCLSSESWGGRSANRGQCAQACRLPYEFIVDNKRRDDDMGYLLSPQDLCGIDQVPQLIEAGVSCLKIEGRLKDERYVAATTRAYREAVDNYFTATEATVSKSELAQIFSRGQDKIHNGLTPGFLEGVNHQQLVRGRSPRHRGLYCGILKSEAWLELSSKHKGKSYYRLCFSLAEESHTLKVGDGIVLDASATAAYEYNEIGGRVVAVDPHMAIELRRDLIDDNELPRAGTLVWKTADPEVDAKFKTLAQPAVSNIVKRTAVDLFVSSSGLELRDTEHCVRIPLTEDKGSLLPRQKVLQAVGSLGDTPWRLGKVEIDEPRCSASSIKAARRQAVSELRELRQAKLFTQSSSLLPRHTVQKNAAIKRIKKKGIAVLVRSIEQCQAVVAFASRPHEADGYEIDEIVLDFLEVKGVGEAIAYIRAASALRVVIATPRLLLPGEERVRTALLDLQPDAILVRSTGLLQALAQEEIELHGDFSLNAANSITATELIGFGLERLTPAFDLSGPSITQMADEVHCLEAVVHCHLPIFHSSHCVFARHLSNGTDYTDCGHPCERHQIHLRHDGADHLVLADMGCRNTVFNANAQSAAHYLSSWLDAGIRRYRIEFVDETAPSVHAILGAYLDLFQVQGNAPEPLWSLLTAVPNANGRAGGVHDGSYRDIQERPSGATLTNEALPDDTASSHTRRPPSAAHRKRRTKKKR